MEQYRTQSTSASSASVDDVVLSESSEGRTRKVLRCVLVKNQREAEDSVKATIVHQRRGGDDQPWADLDGPGLNTVKAGEAAKMPLRSSETRALYEHLHRLYAIGPVAFRPGPAQYHPFSSEAERIIAADASRAEVIQKLLDAQHGPEVWDALGRQDPNLAARLAVAELNAHRKQVLDVLCERLDTDEPEGYWQSQLRSNPWVFGTAFVEVLDEQRIDLRHTADFPLAVEGGFVDYIEIKKPGFPFWRSSRYRDKFLVPHAELEGAITQISYYLDQAAKKVDSVEFIKEHGATPLKPRGTVVHGRSEGWDEDEWRALRLLNDRLHGVQVITFDMLFARARGVLLAPPAEVEAR
jgi:hypothetical protein